MKKSIPLAASVLFVLFFAACEKEAVTDSTAITVTDFQEIEQEIVGLVNTHRTGLGFAPLAFSPIAYDVATAHTDYMISTGALSHDNFSTRASRVSEAASAESVAENVAKGFPTAKAAFEYWLNSTAHRHTIEADFTHTAVSVRSDVAGQKYYTQIFYRATP